MLTLTWINFALVILAHLNTWRPITFRWLDAFQSRYTSIVQVIAGAVVTFRYVRNFKHMPSPDYLNKMVYGDGPPESVRIAYRMNWASYFLYQAPLCLFLL